jgi:phage-related protein
MKKTVIQLTHALEFAYQMSDLSQKKYAAIRKILEEQGYVHAPLAEKIEGQKNLFAIRIMTDGNERFFYCYAIADIIYVLCGYEKKTRTIPLSELARALAIKKEIGL